VVAVKQRLRQLRTGRLVTPETDVSAGYSRRRTDKALVVAQSTELFNKQGRVESKAAGRRESTMLVLIRCVAVAMLAFAASTSTCFAQSGCTHKRSFDGEQDPCLDQAPSPPPSVVASILATKEASETFAEMEPADRTGIPNLFKGLPVHLRSKQQKDMIVRGDPPMSGGDNVWFWIVTSIDSHPSAIWVQGNTVTILRVRHHGYADIRTGWAAGSHSATRIFRNDGRRYKLFREDYKELPPV
jgi:hypothetical protein